MRTYKPTYSPRYTPRPAGEPAAPQASLCAMPDQTPEVIPASELYGREAKSVRALFADSRISGPCRVTEFDGSGIPSYVKVVPPKSPYFAIRLHPEQYAAVRAATGLHPTQLDAPLYCGCQPGDQPLATAYGARDDLESTGIMRGVYAGAGCDDPPDLTAS